MCQTGTWYLTARGTFTEQPCSAEAKAQPAISFSDHCGAVFELSPPKTKGDAWTEKVLHSFAGGTDGANPNGDLVLDNKGNVYGTTYAGGNNSAHDSNQGCGTVFELKPPATKGRAWTENVMFRFNPARSWCQADGRRNFGQKR